MFKDTYKVISKAYPEYEDHEDGKISCDDLSDPIDVEFEVKANTLLHAELIANDYMLNNYGHKAYDIDTTITYVMPFKVDITEVKKV